MAIIRVCRHCGSTFASRGGARVCGPDCRRGRNAVLAQESRARRTLADPAFQVARAVYNKRLLAESPEARAAKQAADRRYRQGRSSDPGWTEAERERWDRYYAGKAADPAYRERQRQRMADSRRDRELDRMRQEIGKLSK